MCVNSINSAQEVGFMHKQILSKWDKGDKDTREDFEDTEEVHKDKMKTTLNLDRLNENRKKLQVEISRAQLAILNKENDVKRIENQVKKELSKETLMK